MSLNCDCCKGDMTKESDNTGRYHVVIIGRANEIHGQRAEYPLPLDVCSYCLYWLKYSMKQWVQEFCRMAKEKGKGMYVMAVGDRPTQAVGFKTKDQLLIEWHEKCFKELTNGKPADQLHPSVDATAGGVGAGAGGSAGVDSVLRKGDADFG